MLKELKKMDNNFNGVVGYSWNCIKVCYVQLKKKSMAKNDMEMPSSDFENIDLRKKFIVFGMAAMPFPLWFGDCFHGKSLAYLCYQFL